MMIEGKVDWVVSDHACCSKEQKVAEADPDNITKAKSGFGGAEWLLSGMFSEGVVNRGLSPNRVAELTSANPAKRFSLHGKGDIAVGKDADFVLLNPSVTFVVSQDESPSTQGYSVFEGQQLTGKVEKTFLRGTLKYDKGKILGPAGGKHILRGGGKK
jgi:allantoinase